MIVSFMGTGLSHTILGTYVLLSATTNINLSAVHWIPVVSFSMMLFIGSCGALPIPYVILSEILPDKVSDSVAVDTIKYLHKFLIRQRYYRTYLLPHRYGALAQRSVCAYLGA